jgi:hypothetical protein
MTNELPFRLAIIAAAATGIAAGLRVEKLRRP